MAGSNASSKVGACPTPIAEVTELSAIEAMTDTAAALTAFDRLHQSVRQCADPIRESALLARWTNYAVNHGDHAAALVAENLRYSQAARAGLNAERADAASRLGILLTERGEYDLAERRLLEASAGLEVLSEWPRAADVYSRLSRLHRRSGDYIAALGDEQRALSLRRRMDPPPNVWRSLLNLAVLYEQLEQSAEARRLYGEALDEAEREGNTANVATVLNSFAGFLNDFGVADAAQALAMAQRALELDRPGDSAAGLAGGLLQVGRAQLNLGHYEAAEKALREGLAVADGMKSRALHTHLLFRLGELALAQGALATALERVEQARLAYESQGNRHRLIKVQAVLEQIHLRRGEPLKAAHAGRERFRLRDELLGSRANSRISELLARFELGEERLRNSQLEQAKSLAEVNARSERRQSQLVGALAAVIAAASLLLLWRHLTVRRLFRQLEESRDLVQVQAAELSATNTRLIEQSERLLHNSITDALTGIANRARIMQQLRDALEHAAADGPGAQVAVLLLDVDHFKQVNDRHGHPAGDQALIAVAHAVEDLLGGEISAKPGRVGGEEFLVVAEGAAAASAERLAERLRDGVARQPVNLPDGSVLQLTVSIGLHQARRGENLEQVYSLADTALYQAKKYGRNRVVQTAPDVPMG